MLVYTLGLLPLGCGAASDPAATATTTVDAGESLNCPGDAKGFDASASWHGDNQALLTGLPRGKDEAQDILGVPAGAWFSGEAAAGVAAQAFATATSSDFAGFAGYARYAVTGRKARSKAEAGLTATPFASEKLAIWSGLTPHVTQALTDDQGAYTAAPLLLPAKIAGLHAAFADLLAAPNQACAPHYLLLKPAAAQVVVTDIDGTLTTADAEFLHELTDMTYDPKEMTSACAMLQVWAAKGYPIVYLTARPHIGRAESRQWLAAHQCPVGPMLTANELVMDEKARTHKALWLKRLTLELGWKVAAAYGNATSDIHAYADAGVALDHTFIVGPHGGEEGTTPVIGNNYTDHLEKFAKVQPAAP
jgi:hypothetical protein